MTRYVSRPDHHDVHPGTLALRGDARALECAIAPWIRKNPRFTQGALLALVGLQLPDDALETQDVWRKLLPVLPVVGVQKVAELPDGTAIYGVVGREHTPTPDDGELEVDSAGLRVSNDRAPQPPADQVEVCREWVRLHCRRTLSVRRRASSYAMKHAVEAWSETVPELARRLQLSGQTGRFYRSSRYYVCHGALIRAMQLEGYAVEPAKAGSRTAVFDASIRRTGAAFRGRPSVPQKTTWEEVPARRVSKNPGAELLKKARRFLDRRRQIGQPQFEAYEAGGSLGIRMSRRRPPRVLTDLLESEGCVCVQEVVDWGGRKRRHRLWCRWPDMPESWRRARSWLDPADPRDNPGKVGPRRPKRAPATPEDFLRALTRAGFEPRGPERISGKQKHELPGARLSATRGPRRLALYRVLGPGRFPVPIRRWSAGRFTEEEFREVLRGEGVVLDSQCEPEVTETGDRLEGRSSTEVSDSTREEAIVGDSAQQVQ